MGHKTIHDGFGGGEKNIKKTPKASLLVQGLLHDLRSSARQQHHAFSGRPSLSVGCQGESQNPWVKPWEVQRVGASWMICPSEKALVVSEASWRARDPLIHLVHRP